MYPMLHQIFSDKKGGEIFTCFGGWHFFYIILAIATVALSIWVLRNKEQSVKDKALRVFIGIGFGLYMADIFLMPFAYGEIDVDKLPFHSCTALCVACFLSNHVSALKKYRVHFAMFAFFSNLMYLVYPAGVMWYEIHPLSYRAVQTLLFHASMVVYGILTMVLEWRQLQIKRCYRDLILLGGMTVWAILGNALYSGAADGYDRDFNWFFVKADPFGLFSAEIAQYVAPILNIVAFFSLELLVYLTVRIVEKRLAKKAPNA